MNCNHMNGERHKGKQRGLNLETDAKPSGSEGRGQEKKAQWQRWKSPDEEERGQVLKKCKNSPPEAVLWGFSLFKPHLRSSKCKGSQGLCGFFLLWLFWLQVGSTRWWCVLRIESPHPLRLGIWGLLSPNPSGSWLRTEAEGGRRGSHIVAEGEGGKDDEKNPFIGIWLDGQAHALSHWTLTSVSWKREEGGRTIQSRC